MLYVVVYCMQWKSPKIQYSMVKIELHLKNKIQLSLMLLLLNNQYLLLSLMSQCRNGISELLGPYGTWNVSAAYFNRILCLLLSELIEIPALKVIIMKGNDIMSESMTHDSSYTLSSVIAREFLGILRICLIHVLLWEIRILLTQRKKLLRCSWSDITCHQTFFTWSVLIGIVKVGNLNLKFVVKLWQSKKYCLELYSSLHSKVSNTKEMLFAI